MASSEDSPLSKTEHIAFTIAFTLVALTIIVGNSLTIAAFTKTKLIRRPTHYFLISLAVADLIVGAFAMPLYITHFIAPFFWKKSQIIQTLYYTIDITSGMASVFTLAVVSVERLYAFGWPWRYRNSSSLKCYIAGVAFTWLSAAVISWPLFGTSLQHHLWSSTHDNSGCHISFTGRCLQRLFRTRVENQASQKTTPRYGKT